MPYCYLFTRGQPRRLSGIIAQRQHNLLENSTDGMIRERGGALLSSKAEGRKGYGLESVRATAKRYEGDARFVYDNEKRVFCSSVLLTCGGG
jgi:hypothetical protein